MVILLRILFVVASAAIGSMFAQSQGKDIIIGLLLGSAGSLIIVFMEFLLKKVSVKELVTLLAGLMLGIIMGTLFSTGISYFLPQLKDGTYAFVPAVIYLFSIYFGISLALNKKDEIL